MDKPKCAGCREVGMEEEYWWHPQNKELWHSSCAVQSTQGFPWNRVEDPAANEREFIRRILMNNVVLLAHVREGRRDELDKFYGKVVEKRGIAKAVFDEVVTTL